MSLTPELALKKRLALKKQYIEHCERLEEVDNEETVTFKVQFTLEGWCYYTQKIIPGGPVLHLANPGDLHFWENIPLNDPEMVIVSLD